MSAGKAKINGKLYNAASCGNPDCPVTPQPHWHAVDPRDDDYLVRLPKEAS